MLIWYKKYVNDYDRWNKNKKMLSSKNNFPFFRVGEVWWCNLGINIGSEQNGSGKNFERPILIIKKYTQNTFLSLPMTSKSKEGNYFYKTKFGNIVILSQSRLIDARRLQRKINAVGRKELRSIIKSYKEII